MTTPFNDSPEDLVALRATVEEWLEKAMHAVWSFHNKSGSFWRDTNQPNGNQNQAPPSSLTASARSHMALTYAIRYQAKNFKENLTDWTEGLRQFISDDRLQYTAADGLTDSRNQKPENDEGKDTKDGEVNNFELAHLADFVFVSTFFKRFSIVDSKPQNEIQLLKKEKQFDFIAKISDLIAENLKDPLERQTDKGQTWSRKNNSEEKDGQNEDTVESGNSEDPNNLEDGQVFFESGQRDSRHFFVTLHSLRSLAIMGMESKLPSSLDHLTKPAMQFCVEQCYYSQRGQRHLQDIARLAFAGVIYCMYAPRVDKDLCLAIVEALTDAQLESGNWPATHPIMRNEGKDPWYISTHEIALCLTWLYFQPRVPDSARPLLLEMMQKYFVNWIVPTHLRITRNLKSGDEDRPHEFMGWYDDRSTGHDVVVGWATAIVCHFLANYYSVLNDHINRRVIESLDLEEHASNYLIDETENKRNLRWRKELENNDHHNGKRKLITWPDLPPFSWPQCARANHVLADEIAWLWSDPEVNDALSRRLASNVLAPIFETPDGRPSKKYSAGILDGPPGTRKTSLVGVLARILEWPPISVPASVMFSKGFDQMETQASIVFRRLNYLTQCIIFFDEFEEFFRDRKSQSGAAIHDRTIAAFTTSAMLPRLQELHDARRTLVFLATNHLRKVDDAIIRPGRFDFKEIISHPTIARFIGGKSGVRTYLQRPPKRLLEQLAITTNEMKRSIEVGENGQDKLNVLAKAVTKALRNAGAFPNITEIRRSLRHFRATRRDLDENMADDQIPFDFVEEALRAVEKKWKFGETNDDKLVFIANRALVDICKRSTGKKGPPELPEP